MDAEVAINWRKRLMWLAIFCTWCVAFAYFSDYNWPTGTGNLCLVLFFAANIYVPAKWLRKRYRFRGAQPYFNWLLRSHCYVNSAAFITAVIHCRTTSWTNNWLFMIVCSHLLNRSSAVTKSQRLS